MHMVNFARYLFLDKLYSGSNMKKISFFLTVLHKSLARSRDMRF